tara:strand:- start:454 stop:1122 length:669 start_codon:yes stop_codon:yes gene_type:complete
MKSYWDWNKKNFDWHFDSQKKVDDVHYVGQFTSDELESSVNKIINSLTDEDKFTETKIKGTFYNKESQDVMEGYHNDLEKAGYTEYNTGGRQTRNLPDIFHKMGELSGLDNPQIMFLEQPSGRIIPWHRDSYNNYRRNFAKVSDDTEVIRYLIQLNDWNWGHHILVGNSAIHQYKLGDIHCWEEGIYHSTANSGYWPRYCMTITGIVTDTSLHKQLPKEVKI